MESYRVGCVVLASTIGTLSLPCVASADVASSAAMKRAMSSEVHGTVKRLVRTDLTASGIDQPHLKLLDAQRADKDGVTTGTRPRSQRLVPGPCSPNIYTIDGRLPVKVTLTPVAPYNEIVIAGCGFGVSQPASAAAVHFFGPGLPQSDLTINQWNDTKIVATIDSSISGVFDATGTVTLVVEPVDKPQLSAPRLSFYAARDPNNPYLVPIIPVSAISLGAPSISDVQTAVCNPVVPCSGNAAFNGTYAATPAPGAGAEVFRFSEGRFSVGNDVYHFEGLAPGFTPYSFQIYPEALGTGTCNVDLATSTYYTDGNWDAAFNAANDVVVMVQEQHCHSAPALSNNVDVSLSHYFSTFYVLGPRGLTAPNFWAQQ